MVDGRAHRAWRAWSGWILLAAGLGILILRIDTGAVPANRLFHPEALYPAALYLDLDNWSTWNTPFSPYFFPDIPLFFLAMWITGDVVRAVYGFAVVQFTLLLLGFYWLFGGILSHDPPARRTARSFSVLGGASLALLFAWNLHGRGLFLQLFSAAFHTGSFVLAVFGQAILIALLDLKKPPRAPAAREYGYLLLLFFICFFGSLSDKLLLALFVLPALLTLFLAARRRSPSGRLLRTALSLSAGGLLGILAIPWINSQQTIQVPALGAIDFFGVVDSLRALPGLEEDLAQFVRDRFFENLGTAYRAYWFLWFLTTLLLTLACRRWLSRRAGFRSLELLHPGSRSNLVFFAVFTILSITLTALATNYVAVGRYGVQVGYHGILFIQRYLIAIFTIPLVTVALYLPVFLGARKALRLELPLLAVLGVVGVMQGSQLDLTAPFPRYRPADIACLDEKAAAYGLKYGLAFFSDARRVNVFSRRDLHADQLTWELEPITWIGSRQRAGEETGYDFVMTTHLKSKADVIERMGSPDHELDCPGMNVFVYDEPVGRGREAIPSPKGGIG